MIQKLFLIFSISILISGTVQAHTIVDDVDFNLGNGIIVTVTAPQTFDRITVYNPTDTPASTLEIVINGKPLQLTPSASATLTINSYDTTNDSYNITISGAGTTTLLQNVSKSNTLYSFFKGSDYTFGVTSNNTGWIIKTGITAGTYTYPALYTLPVGGGAPPAPPDTTPAPGTTPTNGSTGTGGAGGAPGAGLPGIDDIAAQLPNINIKTIAATDTGSWLFYLLMLLGLIMMVLGASSKKVTRTTMFWGLAIVIFSSYALGVIA